MDVLRFDAYFVRHAQSAANAGFATADPATIPLTAIRHQQAEDLAERLPVGPTVIVTSPFLRAQQTASPLHAQFQNARRISMAIQEFTYLDPLPWRNSTPTQRLPAVDAYWQRSAVDELDGEGAESFAMFVGRIDPSLHWLTQQSPAPIVFVSHEMFILGVVWRCISSRTAPSSITMKAFRAWQAATPLPNASVTRVRGLPSGQVEVTLPLELSPSREALIA